MKKSIVVSTHRAKFNAVAFKGDVEANLEKVARFGYDGAELAIRDPRAIDLDEIVRLLRKYGLVAPAIGTGQAWGEEGLSFTDPDAAVRRAAIDRVKSHVPVAERLGAVIIIGLLRGIVRPGVGRDQAVAWMVEAFKECAEAAARRGVRIAMEPINRYETTLVNSARDGLAVIEQVGADNLGLLLDTFHMNIEEPDMCESIRLAGPRIFHFHVADSNRWYPGAGHIDFPGIIAALREVGYRGYVSVEAMPMPDADTCAEKSVAAMRSWGLQGDSC